MFEQSPQLSIDLSSVLLEELKNIVLRVKRARKWFLVDPLSKALLGR